MGGRGGVTFLAAAVLVDVELGAERPQRPLLLESALENEKRERIECLLRLREGKKKIFVASLNLNSIAVTFRNWEEEQEFQNYRAHYPLTERHPERYRSPRTESRERTKVEFEQRERTKLSTTRETF